MTEVATREPRTLRIVTELPPPNEPFSIGPKVGFFTGPVGTYRNEDFESTGQMELVSYDRQRIGIVESFLVSRTDGKPMGKFDSQRLWIARIEGRAVWLPMNFNYKREGVVNIRLNDKRLPHEYLKPGTVVYTGPGGTIENQETEVLDEETRVAILHGEQHRGIISQYVRDDDGGEFWIVGNANGRGWVKKKV